MRSLNILALGIASCFSINLARATSSYAATCPGDFCVTLTVDENGHGNLSNTAGFSSPLPFAMKADPGPGGKSSVLFYDMLNPPGLTQGDLILVDPGTLTVSDIIRFDPNSGISGVGGLFFYSIADGDSLADVGLPGTLNNNAIAVIEVVNPDGSSGFVYTPTSGQPGFVAGAGGPVTYDITSDDPIPEPASLALIGTGAVLMGLIRFKRARG